MKIETKKRPPLNDIESAIIDIFIRACKILGYPKSIGEIYGLLYISEEPLCMEDIIQRLGISLGAASQGLKVLKGMRAVKSNHMIGKRREYFRAELEVKELVNRYIEEEFAGYLKNWKQQQESIRDLFNDNGCHETHSFLENRLVKLEELHSKSQKLLNKICDDFED